MVFFRSTFRIACIVWPASRNLSARTSVRFTGATRLARHQEGNNLAAQQVAALARPLQW